jgi:hypothetical protein
MISPFLRIGFGLGVVLLSSAVLAAQDPTHEEILGKMLGSLEQMGKTLGAINDETTATSARPELKKLADEFRETRKMSETVVPPNPEEREKIAKAWGPKFLQVRKVLEAELARVRRIPGGKETVEELRVVFETSGKK